MNKKREPYDRIAVGERIRHKRIQLGLSQDELAVRINRATKYCSDIERGMCGMSIETMLAIAKALDMNLDYITVAGIVHLQFADLRCHPVRQRMGVVDPALDKRLQFAERNMRGSRHLCGYLFTRNTFCTPLIRISE